MKDHDGTLCFPPTLSAGALVIASVLATLPRPPEARAGGRTARITLMAKEGDQAYFFYAPALPRFERDPHFCCPGQFAAGVPAGKVSLRVERGPEYVPFTTELPVSDGQTVQVPVQLTHWIDMNERG